MPLLVDGRLIVAATRIEGNRSITAVSCYDPAEAGTTINMEARCDRRAGRLGRATWTLPMTQCDGQIVLGPHSGGIVALDSATGQPASGVRREVPKRASGELMSSIGRTCLAKDGAVYVSFTELDRVVAVDSVSGATFWESEPLEAIDLLGSAGGKLFVQTGGMAAGVIGLDCATGRRLPNWGYSVFCADSAPPFGRGIVLGDRACWPTRNAGVLIARLDGTPEYAPAILRGLPGGNLIYAGGFLLVATPDKLYGVAAISDPPAAQPVQSRIDRNKTTGSLYDRGCAAVIAA